MELNMRLIIVLNVFIGLILSQTVELSDISRLSEDAKREYFRSHLVVKKGGFGKTTYNNWTVYQGLDNQLGTQEFFTLVGYQPEDSDFSLRTKLPWKAFRYLGILGGYQMITTVEREFDEDAWEYKDTYPLAGPGYLFLIGGLYAHYFIKSNPQIMQYESAKQIANDYNKKLINKLQ